MAWDDEATGEFGAMPGAWGGGALPNSNFNSMNSGLPIGDPFYDTPPPWWQDPKTQAELKGLSQGLGGVKPLADTGSGMPARPPYPAAGIHQGASVDALGQYLQMLQARQQALRTQFLPKTAGLLGG